MIDLFSLLLYALTGNQDFNYNHVTIFCLTAWKTMTVEDIIDVLTEITEEVTSDSQAAKTQNEADGTGDHNTQGSGSWDIGILWHKKSNSISY